MEKERVLAYDKSTPLREEELRQVSGGKCIFKDIFNDMKIQKPSANFSGYIGNFDGNVEVRVQW